MVSRFTTKYICLKSSSYTVRKFINMNRANRTIYAKNGGMAVRCYVSPQKDFNFFSHKIHKSKNWRPIWRLSHSVPHISGRFPSKLNCQVLNNLQMLYSFEPAKIKSSFLVVHAVGIFSTIGSSWNVVLS